MNENLFINGINEGPVIWCEGMDDLYAKTASDKCSENALYAVHLPNNKYGLPPIYRCKKLPNGEVSLIKAFDTVVTQNESGILPQAGDSNAIFCQLGHWWNPKMTIVKDFTYMFNGTTVNVYAYPEGMVMASGSFYTTSNLTAGTTYTIAAGVAKIVFSDGCIAKIEPRYSPRCEGICVSSSRNDFKSFGKIYYTNTGIHVTPAVTINANSSVIFMVGGEYYYG